MYFTKNCRCDCYLLCTISAPDVSLAAPYNRKKKLAHAWSHRPVGLDSGTLSVFHPGPEQSEACCWLTPIKAGRSWSVTTAFFSLCCCCTRTGKGGKKITLCSHVCVTGEAVVKCRSSYVRRSSWVVLSFSISRMQPRKQPGGAVNKHLAVLHC